MEFITHDLLNVLDRIGVVTVLAAIALGVITDRLVWHTRLKNETKRGDRWEAIALEALRSGAQAGVAAAETTAAVVSAMPDPARRGG